MKQDQTSLIDRLSEVHQELLDQGRKPGTLTALSAMKRSGVLRECLRGTYKTLARDFATAVLGVGSILAVSAGAAYLSSCDNQERTLDYGRGFPVQEVVHEVQE